jgi:hypothetical protein
MPGTWQPLVNQPMFSASTMLLLTDGTVICQNEGKPDWWKLTPDQSGSYVNGKWSALASMPNSPEYFASAVLKDGRLFVAGGEYNNGDEVDLLAAEIYDPLSNAWTTLSTPAGWDRIGDAQSCVLPDGRVIIGSLDSNETAIFDPVTGTWSAAATKNNENSNEEGWTLMPNQSIVTADCHGHPQTERYLIAANKWVIIGNTPVDLVEAASLEIGPALLLPDGRLFAIGATGATALYTMPSNPNQQGNWAPGPSFPSQIAGQTLGAKDAPACLLPNGRVLCVAGPVDGTAGNFSGPTYFFEFDPVTSNLTPIQNPSNNDPAPFEGRMLLIPTGQVLFANGTNNIEVYTPDGMPYAGWKPTITNYPQTMTAGQTYTISGTQFNGLSQACSYGDDAQMATNYPIVRLTNRTTGAVTFLRTFNHSTMAVATGNSPQNTNVTVPGGIPTGQWNLVVVANGIASDPVTVNT